MYNTATLTGDTYLAITLAKLDFLVAPLKLSPVGRG